MALAAVGKGKVFETGEQAAKLFSVDGRAAPKPLLIAAPVDSNDGGYPVLLFFHGYCLLNSFYSQLFLHVASHGFIVVGPQLYSVSGPDCTEEIKSAAAVADWVAADGLSGVLPPGVRADITKAALAGHSRGGKVAFALALGSVAVSTLHFSALIGVDPVDGLDVSRQTTPAVLKYVPQSLELKQAALVIGSGLGGERKNSLFPPCAPEGLSHRHFFAECGAPAWHVVARDYGHTDMLDDEIKGVRGMLTRCICKNGESRGPMRAFVGGMAVAFLRSYLEGDAGDLLSVREHPESAPVVLSIVECRE